MNNYIIGTAGHVDHGKTALIKALTGTDCDTHQEEKKRGITIHLGFTNITLPLGEQVGIVDVPGHKDFIKTMVAGASGVDFTILTVAANSGVMPQTREHLQIMQVLGITHGIVVITKSDLVQVEEIELVSEEILELTRHTFLQGCKIAVVSAENGNGLDELKAHIENELKHILPRPREGVFRMFVDRIFSISGFGTVVTGSVMSGVLRKEAMAFVSGNRKHYRIRKLERHGEDVVEINGGQRASINLAGLERNQIERGMQMTDRLLRETNLLDAHIVFFQKLVKPVKWIKVIYYLGSFYCQAKIHIIHLVQDKNEALVQIHLEHPCPVQWNDRFVIRATSNDITLGGGEVLDPAPLHHRRATEKIKSALITLNNGSLPALVTNLVKSKLHPMGHKEIAEAVNLSVGEINQALKGKTLSGIAVACENGTSVLWGEERYSEACKKVTKDLLRITGDITRTVKGKTREELLRVLALPENDSSKIMTDHLLKSLVQKGTLKLEGRFWLSIGEMKTIDRVLEKQKHLLLEYIRAMDLKTLSKGDLIKFGKQNGVGDGKLKSLLYLLHKEGTLYEVNEAFIHASIVDKCRSMLLKELNAKDGITIAAFRDLIQGNRKICLNLMAIFDSEEIVERKGDYRYITEKGRGEMEKSKVKSKK